MKRIEKRNAGALEMLGVAGHDGEPMFERGGRNGEIEFHVADLRGKPSPAAGDVHGERQDALAECMQSPIEPRDELLGKRRI